MSGTERALSQTAWESDNARESFSQLVARILDQLSLAAWLPSAALVMLTTLSVQVADAVAASPRDSVSTNLATALSAIGDVSVGGGALLLGAVVVLTMVTQAFSFEAIRGFEGYWGTSVVFEWLADLGCAVQGLFPVCQADVRHLLHLTIATGRDRTT